MNPLRFLVVALLCVAPALPAGSLVPGQVSYQGLLLDSAGSRRGAWLERVQAGFEAFYLNRYGFYRTALGGERRAETPPIRWNAACA